MKHVVSYYVGYFLRIFSAILLLPVVVGKLYGESFVALESYIIASFISIALGTVLIYFADRDRPDAIEGMMAATAGWLLAVSIGGIPFMDVLGFSFVDAFFEAMSGFSTTGMSLVASVEGMPNSLIFWRAFMQWIGGLGILTFFVTVVVEAGGAATSLISAEANKTDSGSIRPSLFNAIKSLWFVYIAFTVMQSVALYFAGMQVFDSIMYSLSTLPTGGFSHTVGGLAAYSSTVIETIMVVFMVAGGTNFLLLYRVLRGDLASMFRDEEFRLYMGIMGVAALLIFGDLLWQAGLSAWEAVRQAVFATASVTSSTGFELKAVASFPELSRMLFFGLMFVGGCLGSTTGGIKVFRLDILFKIVAREIRSFSLPSNALNMIRSKGKRIMEDQLTRIVAIFFVWLAVMFVGGIVTVAMTDLSMVHAAQGMVSSMGTMGPLFISQETLIALPDVVKLFWSFGMLAGRLEMLPILVLLNVEIVKRFK